jgi:hypothetical protein
MLARKFVGLIFAGLLTVGGATAEVVVRIGPPHAVVERRGPAPGRGYIWVPGYHNWNGNSHVWVPGRWEQPPRARARWVPHHWVKRRGGWVLVEGHWR